MRKIRDWAFPAGLLLVWFIASIYTVIALVDATAEHRRLLNPVTVNSPQT